MLFVSILKPEIPLHLEGSVQGVEFRIDLFPQLSIDSIQTLLKNSPLPVLLTLRKKSHGGSWQGTEEQREAAIHQLLALEPPFFDLEYDMRPLFLKTAIQKYPKTRLILSSHHFGKEIPDLEKIFHAMQQYPVFGYKIAALSESTHHSLHMLALSQKHPKLSLICMGEKGSFARILGPVVRNGINYAALNDIEKTAPGQLSIAELTNIYRYSSLNPQTDLYGLIGDPVHLSQGHIYHNSFFQQLGLNALYVKMSVAPNELASFLPLAKKFPFKGLSVTMPLKEKIVSFLDQMDDRTAQIGAVNTLLIKNNLILGTNTDGIGALNALEKRGPVRNKNIVLLGAGGAARAIAFEAKQRGAHLTILNRTVERAKQLALSVDGAWGSLTEVPKEYDVLVQCTPDSLPIAASEILPQAIVMDTLYVPRETPLLQAAARLGCPLIFGEEMFQNQAEAQRTFWLGNIS